MCEFISSKQKMLLDIVNSAIVDFNEKEAYLISRDLSERCICSKFASYLEKALSETEFRSYYVDVEYNRGKDGREDRPKVLDGNIVVDLIVHMRGYQVERGFNNLLCVEMKKSYRKVDYSPDLERLHKLTDSIHGFNYALGLMIMIDANKRENTYGLRIEKVYYGASG